VCREPPYFVLLLALPVEERCGAQHAGQQKGGVDGRQLAPAGPAAGRPVEEVIVEAFVSGRVRFRTLGAVVQEPQQRSRSRRGIGARHPATRNTYRERCQPEAGCSDACRGTRLRRVGNEPVRRVGVLQEILERMALQHVEARLAEVEKWRVLRCRHDFPDWFRGRRIAPKSSYRVILRTETRPRRSSERARTIDEAGRAVVAFISSFSFAPVGLQGRQSPDYPDSTTESSRRSLS